MITRLAPALILLAAVAAPTAAQSQPDPCDVTKFSAARTGTYSNAYGDAEWWVPDDPGWDNETAPIVVIRHGNMMNFSDYPYLLEHLALNGFVAASVTGAPEDLLDHVATLKLFFGVGDDAPVGLLGHSVGGKSVVDAAVLNEQMGKPHDLQAVMALAPAPGEDLPLPATACDSLFVMYGSHDEDVTGWKNASPPASFHPPTNGFSLYDQAGTEANMDDLILFPWDPPMRKNMVFIYGADHNAFRDVPPWQLFCPAEGALSQQTHQNLLKCYATGYFLWQLQGEFVYEDLLDGRYLPDTVLFDSTETMDDWGNPPGSPIRLFFQSSKTRRRVVANFETPSVPFPSQFTFLDEDDAHDLTWYSPHETGVMEVTWFPIPNIGFQWLLFFVPDDFDPWTGTKQNVVDFESVSFRAGQVYVPEDDIYNPNPEFQDQQFSFVLIDEDLGFHLEPVQTWGTIPYPDKFFYEVGGFGLCKAAADYSKVAMSTISIPLSVFDGSVDLTRVIAVGLVFADGSGGRIHLDNIEFTN